ncbi:MAG: ATP-binding cassette domain-containing protein [Treponema sp.]|jgi:ABC-type lipoprotein export system ATPase subunit|nr:ATP-binding cassette domain-containing protein [Treponema sp.]
MAEIIELKNAGFSAQNRKILQNVSISFEASKATAIVGPSGGGKSTLLKLAAGLLVPDQGGEVLYNGKNIAHMNRAETLEFRREAAFVFQDSALWANQNLFQILELPLRIHFPEMTKKEREKRIKSAVAEAGYKKDLGVRPSQLSMGEQKLIAFARAMLCSPTLLFLDEWTESLDETARDHLVNLVKIRRREKASILFVSHDLRTIKDVADDVIIIVDGTATFATSIDLIVDNAVF